MASSLLLLSALSQLTQSQRSTTTDPVETTMMQSTLVGDFDVEVYLGGYFYGNDPDIPSKIDSLTLPNDLVPSPMEYTEATFGNMSTTYFWNGQSVEVADLDDVDSLETFYRDFDSLNEEIVDLDYGNPTPAVSGCLLFCTDSACDQRHVRPGSDSWELPLEYDPVQARLDNDPSRVVLAWNEEDDWYTVVVHWYWYYQAEYEGSIINPIIADFFHADSFEHVSDAQVMGEDNATMVVHGVHEYMYTSLSNLMDDVGTPDSWAVGYVYESLGSTDKSQYVAVQYSRVVVCSNHEMYEQYLGYPFTTEDPFFFSTTEDDEPSPGAGGYGFSGWEIIGIIFGCIVFMGVVLAGYVMLTTGGSDDGAAGGSPRKKGGYQKAGSTDQGAIDGHSTQLEMN